MQLDRARREDGGQRVHVLLDRVCELVVLHEPVGPCEDRLGLRALVGGDTALQEARVDAEAQREPFDRVGGRARLPALDLGDVLLREPVAGEVGLRQAGGDAKLAQALTEARRLRRGGSPVRDPACGARSHQARSMPDT